MDHWSVRTVVQYRRHLPRTPSEKSDTGDGDVSLTAGLSTLSPNASIMAQSATPGSDQHSGRPVSSSGRIERSQLTGVPSSSFNSFDEEVLSGKRHMPAPVRSRRLPSS